MGETLDLKALAEEVHTRLDLTIFDSGPPGGPHLLAHQSLHLILSALQQVRRETLEEAQRIVATWNLAGDKQSGIAHHFGLLAAKEATR